MKIAISTTGNDLDSNVDPRFGRCENFIVVSIEESSFDVIENTAKLEGHGAGLRAAQIVVNANVNAVISGNVGPNAFNVLKNSNITLFTFSGSIKNALTQFKDGKLAEISLPGRSHVGIGGRGGGGGRGRNRQ